MTRKVMRICLRSWFVLSIAVCLIAGDFWAAATCGFFWGVIE